MKYFVVLLFSVLCAHMLTPAANAESACAATYNAGRATLNALQRYYEVARHRKTARKDLDGAWNSEMRLFGLLRAHFLGRDDNDFDTRFSACDAETRFVTYNALTQVLIAIGRVNGGLSEHLLSDASFFLRRMIEVTKKSGVSETDALEMLHRLQGLYSMEHLNESADLVEVERYMQSQAASPDTPADTPSPEPPQ